MAGIVRHRWMLVTAQAWPLCSASAFDATLMAVSRKAPGVLSNASAAVAQDLDEWLRPRAGGLSLEVLRQYREGAWFGGITGKQAASLPLAEYLLSVAQGYLEWRGERVYLKQLSDGDLGERALRWRWLSLLVPEDLLVASLAQHSRKEPAIDAVSSVTPHLKDVLRQPVANTHYHWGAARRFGDIWTSAMTEMAAPCLNLERLENTVELPFNSLQLFSGRLLEAALVRLMLGAFLWRGEATGGGANLSQFLKDSLPVIIGRTSTAAAERVQWLYQLIGRWLSPRVPAVIPEAQLRRLYRTLIGPRRRAPDSLKELAAQDPLCAWLPSGAQLGSAEIRFAIRSLHYIRTQPEDGLFAKLFWQYQRVRCLTHRFLTLEPGTAGLDWFSEHYQRIGALPGGLDNLGIQSALDIDSQDAHLGATEPRTSPSSQWYRVRDTVRWVAKEVSRWSPPTGQERPEVGLILHFIKNNQHESGRALNADPSGSIYGCRYAGWYAKRLAEKRAIEEALRHNPELLLVLRAVDIANTEYAIPFWVCRPLLKGVIEASYDAANRLGRTHPKWKASALRLTVHAGEDYRRLVSGLRAMHEPLESKVMRTGDRIGHGLALGVDPARWAHGAELVYQPRQERLDDLLWELDRYGSCDIPGDAGRIEGIRQEIQKHGQAIYAGRTGVAEVTVASLLRARRALFEDSTLTRLGYPYMSLRAQSTGVEPLVIAYLTSPEAFRAGQESIPIEVVAGEVKMLVLVQAWLRRVLAQQEITIESNPSSNLIIGDLDRLEDHPSLTLMPLTATAEPGAPSIPVSINTDNPLISCTSMANEFAQMYFGLLRLGVSSAHALEWLERARSAGWRSRFTLEASTSQAALNEVAQGLR